MENKRAKNFTPDEIAVLVEQIEKRRSILFGPLKGANLNQFHRDRAWQQVLDAVNAIAPTRRAVKDLKKKFQDLKTRMKQKANALRREGRKTGGGANKAHNPLTFIDEKLIQFIGSESIEGIAGGIDTFAFQERVIEEPPTIIEEPIVTVSQLEDSLNIDRPSTSKDILQLEDPVNVVPQAPPANPVPPAIPGASTSSVGSSKPLKRKRAKTQALDEIRESKELQVETNSLLKDLVEELKTHNSLKKRELQLLEIIIDLKRKKLEKL